MRLIFAGTPEFAEIILRGLIERSPHPIVAVYTQPDRRSGRGQKVTMSPPKSLALAHEIPVEQPQNFKAPAATTALAAYAADLMVVAAYGLLLPPAILQAPRLGCVNVHASILPRWRGAAPIQRAILAGDALTGVTIMQMDAGLDTGAMLARTSCPIGASDTAQEVHDRLASQGLDALLKVLVQLETGTSVAEPQTEEGATYAKRIQKAEAEVDWGATAEHIDRLVRAFNPFPIAYTHFDGRRLRVWAAELPYGTSTEPSPIAQSPGTIVRVSRDGIEVSTGRGNIVLTRLQFPGARALPVSELMNAAPFAVGHRFGA